MPLNIFIDPDSGNDANSGVDWPNAVETITGARNKPGWNGGSFQLSAGKLHKGQYASIHVNVTFQALDYGETIGTPPSAPATIFTASSLIALLNVSAYKFISNDIIFDGRNLLTDRAVGRRSDLGDTADKYQEFNRCEFKNCPQYFELARRNNFAPFRLYDCIVRPAITGSQIKLSQCSGIFEDTLFEFNGSPLIPVWMLNGRNFDQVFTRCAFWYSGDISARTFNDSVYLDGLAAINSVSFINCSFINIYSILSSPTNLATSIGINCIFYNMFSRYISQGFTTAQDACMNLSYSCWFDSPDVTTPAPGTVTRTLINTGVGVFEKDPEIRNPVTGSLMLDAWSPCISSGDPAILGNKDGLRSDMGWIDYIGTSPPKSIPEVASSSTNILQLIRNLLVDYIEEEEENGPIDGQVLQNDISNIN